MDYFFTVHTSPSAFLQATKSSLQQYQRKLNVILPHAEKLAAQERSGQPIKEGQFWITGWSYSSQPQPQSQSNRAPTLEIVLSCTEHHLGTYPIFFVILRDLPTISDASLNQQMRELARQLAAQTDPTRVFSIFGQERSTVVLCRHWSDLTGARLVTEPYYAASSSYCTRATLVKRDHGMPAGHEMRLARQADVQAIATLCQEFAEDSPPFTLTPTRALKEAQYMVSHGLVSVYTIDGQVTTIVAVTRRSESVAGMTKVYTTPKFRGRGCAEKLVAFVTERQLQAGMESVVLFVGHTLAAARVYHRVGYVGVGAGKTESFMRDAENWLELGFHDTTVGHW